MDGEGIDLWDAEDEFFYDVIHSTDGQNFPLRLHSMVGLVPLFAVLAVKLPCWPQTAVATPESAGK